MRAFDLEVVYAVQSCLRAAVARHASTSIPWADIVAAPRTATASRRRPFLPQSPGLLAAPTSRAGPGPAPGAQWGTEQLAPT